MWQLNKLQPKLFSRCECDPARRVCDTETRTMPMAACPATEDVCEPYCTNTTTTTTQPSPPRNKKHNRALLDITHVIIIYHLLTYFLHILFFPFNVSSKFYLSHSNSILIHREKMRKNFLWSKWKRKEWKTITNMNMIHHTTMNRRSPLIINTVMIMVVLMIM